MKTLYLDYNATTPVDPVVLEAMLPWLKEGFGNPSSSHSLGRQARVKVDEAREQVARLIGAHSGEIVFTSGGTEADNLAIFGVAHALREKGRHVLTSQVEHPAVLNPCRELEKQGFDVEYLPVDSFGRVDSDQVLAAVTDQTILVTIQHANSEVGTLQPIERIGHTLRERNVLFHTDAVQSAGKLPLDMETFPVDLLSLSSHKIYGPKGMGALYVRRGTPPLVPLLAGGGQEKKRRGGTENVPGIVGFGQAAQLAKKNVDNNGIDHLRKLRDGFRDRLQNEITRVEFFGHPEECLPNTLNIGFEGVEGQTLMIRLDLEGIAITTGTACSSGSIEPSEVLTALGLPEEKFRQSIRLSLGRPTTEVELEKTFEVLSRAVREIRHKSPVGT